jgi:putative membrane protein
MLAIAASTIFGANILLAVEPNPGAGAGQNAQQPGQAGQKSGQAGEQAGQQAGQQADQQVLQELQKLAQDPQTAPDKLFLLNAALDSMCEVELSQQAQQKAQSDQVKQLAQHLIQDHQQMNQRLQQTAQQLGVQIPQSLTRMKQEEIRVLASLSSREFEQHYVANMNAGHAKDIACFEAASSLSQNPQVKQFATEFLPKLREHRQMVRQSETALGMNLQGDEAIPAGAHLRGTGSDANQGTTPRTGSGTDDASKNGGGAGSSGTGNGSTGQRSSGGAGSSGSGAGSTGTGTGSSGGAGGGAGSSGTGTSGTTGR